MQTMKFSATQRAFIADKLMDSANYALAGLVFGQLITDNVGALLLILGTLLYLWGWTISIWMTKEVKP